MGTVSNDPAMRAFFTRLVEEQGAAGREMVVHVGREGEGVLLVIHNREQGMATVLDWKGAVWTAVSLMLWAQSVLVSTGMTAEEAQDAAAEHYRYSVQRQFEAMLPPGGKK